MFKNKTKKEIDSIKQEIEILYNNIQDLENRLIDRRVLDNKYRSFLYGMDPEQFSIDLPKLKNKVDLMMKHLGLEYKHVEEHYVLTEKEKQ